tara:strand:+ start:582 stop:1484 length:903 start_codon:yes stop_codon:yes gene_type:complete
MSYQQKLDSARALVEEHNSNATTKVDIDGLVEFIKDDLGGTTEDLLKEIKFEDLERFKTSALGSTGVRSALPILLARSIARMFRTSVGKDEDDGSGRVISSKKADQMTYRELLENYDPKDPESHAGKRLKRLSKGQPFIIYYDDGKIAIEESLGLLKDVMNDLPGVDTYMMGETPWSVYRVGERPNHYFNENPLIPGSPLRSGETCEDTKESWKDIGLDIRQLLRLAVQSGAVETKEFFSLIVEARKEGAFVYLSRRYKDAALKFKELKDLGQLPTLKIKTTSHKNKSKANNPFYQHAEY